MHHFVSGTDSKALSSLERIMGSLIWGFHCNCGIGSLKWKTWHKDNTGYSMPSLGGVKCLATSVNSVVIFEQSLLCYMSHA